MLADHTGCISTRAGFREMYRMDLSTVCSKTGQPPFAPPVSREPGDSSRSRGQVEGPRRKAHRGTSQEIGSAYALSVIKNRGLNDVAPSE